jgi:hypothetical protein
MKESLKIFSILILLSILINPFFFSQQKSVWTGKIEHDDGIKVIKNPNDPLYG